MVIQRCMVLEDRQSNGSPKERSLIRSKVMKFSQAEMLTMPFWGPEIRASSWVTRRLV